MNDVGRNALSAIEDPLRGLCLRQLYLISETVGPGVVLRHIHENAFSRIVLSLDHEERGVQRDVEMLCEELVGDTDVDDLVCPVGLMSQLLLDEGDNLGGLGQLVRGNGSTQIGRKVD